MTGFQMFGFITVMATFAVVIVCTILYARILQKRHFKCPYCGARFKSPPVKTFFSAHKGADRLLICPNCGKSGFMEFSHDDEGDGEPAEAEELPEEAGTIEGAEETRQGAAEAESDSSHKSDSEEKE